MELHTDFIDIGVLTKPDLLCFMVPENSNAQEPVELSKRPYLIAGYEPLFKGLEV